MSDDNHRTRNENNDDDDDDFAYTYQRSQPRAGPSSKQQQQQQQHQHQHQHQQQQQQQLHTRSTTRAPLSLDPDWAKDRRYALLVDAGSSGSRMQVYSWKDPAVSKQQRIKQHKGLKILPKVEKGTQDGSGQDWQYKVEPGLSSFGSHPEDLDAYLEPLFTRAQDIIPHELLASTPVYVMATAGMRLLPPVQQQDIINKTCSFIKEQTPFDIPGTCHDHVQVITGEEEGLLGWIAINYLMDGFHFERDDDAPQVHPGVQPSKGESTYGFLDMGGASTQIAFEPSKKALKAADPTQAVQDEELRSVTLKLLDGTAVTHDIFVTTFLGFGTNKARDRYEEQLLKDLDPLQLQAVPDPCLPTGSLVHPSASVQSTISGTGSFTQCLSSLAPLLDKSAPCSHPPCLFHGVHVPPIDFSINHFIGVSEYWFSSNDVFKLGGAYDFVQFQKAAQKFCERPWSELQQSLSSALEFAPQVDENRLKMQCFKAAWMVTVLHDGIGLPRVIDHKGKGDGKTHADEVGVKAGEKNLGQVADIANEAGLFQSVNEVEGTSVSWTLGKAVLEASKDIQSVLTIDPAPALIPHPSHHKPDVDDDDDDEETASSKVSVGDWTSDVFEGINDGFEGLKGLASESTAKISHHTSAAAIVLIAVSLLAFGMFVLTRGKSHAAQRRRATIYKGLCFPFTVIGSLSRRRSYSSRGDYALAEMEEGIEEGDVASANDRDAAAASLSDSSSSDGREGSFRKGSNRSGSNRLGAAAPHKHKQSSRSSHKRRASGGGLMSFIPAPLRRWLWQTAATIPVAHHPGRARRRKKHQRSNSDLLPEHQRLASGGDTYTEGTDMDEIHNHLQETQHLRRAFTPTSMRQARPDSPSLSSLPANLIVSAASSSAGGAISRPASRASGRGSPRFFSTSTTPGGASHHTGQSLSSPSSSLSLSALARSTSPPSHYFASSMTGTASVPFASPTAQSLASSPNQHYNQYATMAWTSSSTHSSVVSGSTTPVGNISGAGALPLSSMAALGRSHWMSLTQAFDGPPQSQQQPQGQGQGHQQDDDE